MRVPGPRWRALLVLLLVFAVGLGVGAMSEDVLDELDRPLFAGHHDHEDGDESEEDLLADLDLTAGQRAAIERVFEAREDRLESYWDLQLPGLEALIDSSRAEVRALLTPAQRTTYDSRVASLRLYPRHELGEDDDD